MWKEEEFFIVLPNERATIGELQEEMRHMERFKKSNWYPNEIHFLLWLIERMRIYTPMSS